MSVEQRTDLVDYVGQFSKRRHLFDHGLNTEVSIGETLLVLARACERMRGEQPGAWLLDVAQHFHVACERWLASDPP